MTAIINTKLGENRGKARIWLEGGKLAREGYLPGGQYDRTVADGKILIKPNAAGAYTVGRKNRKGKTIPIIDICRDDLAEIFDGVEMLRVLVTKGKIVIEAHHQHQRVRERVARLLDRVKTGEPLRVCSLFHGGGLLDKAVHSGLERVGVESKIGVAVELDSAYLESSLENNPELWDEKSIPIESPVQHVRLGHNTPQMDIVLAGIPCTGASRSGKTKNKLKHAEEHESAGALFFNFLNFVETINPAIVWVENVSEYANTASMAVIRSVLTSLGYDVQERILDGNEFGALERRQRLCAVGVSKGLEGVFDLDAVMPHVTKPAQIKDVIDWVPLDSDRWKAFDYLAEKELRDKAAGKGFVRQLLTGEEGHCGTIGRHYAKFRSTEPFLVHPAIPELSRLFTPAEHARLKGAPENVVDGLADTIAHQVLGQAIVYPAFEAVAMSLGRALRAKAGLRNDHLVEVWVDTLDPANDGCIGGDDIGQSLALLNCESGELKLVAGGRHAGWPMATSQYGVGVSNPRTGHGFGLSLVKPGDQPACPDTQEDLIKQHVRTHGESWVVELGDAEGSRLLSEMGFSARRSATMKTAA